MKKILCCLLLITLPVLASETGVSLDKYAADTADVLSLQRGAQAFMTYCSGCHSLQYARYGRIARDLEIPEDLFMEHLLFGDKKMGDLVISAFDPAEAKRWFGVSPPDLSLIARKYSSDWLYTYLRSFYEDKTRPYGVNNLLVPGVSMPHILAPLQGMQVQGCAQIPTNQDPLTGFDILEKRCNVLSLAEPGSLEPRAFNNFVKDLVNFLVYVGEPAARDRVTLGMWVLLFIACFFIPVYLLNKEYWKDIH